MGVAFNPTTYQQPKPGGREALDLFIDHSLRGPRTAVPPDEQQAIVWTYLTVQIHHAESVTVINPGTINQDIALGLNRCFKSNKCKHSTYIVMMPRQLSSVETLDHQT